MTARSSLSSTGAVAPQRLHRSADIRSVFAARRKAVGRYVVVHFRDSEETADEQPPRAAVVAGRRVGSAVRRNRAKRRLRYAVRECGMPAGRDAVLVARVGADTAPYEVLRSEVAAGCWRGAHG